MKKKSLVFSIRLIVIPVLILVFPLMIASDDIIRPTIVLNGEDGSEGMGDLFGNVFGTEEGYSLEETLDLILEDNPVIAIGEANEAYYQGLRDQAFAQHIPTLNLFTYVAPTPGIDLEDPNTLKTDYNWGNWGVFYRLEASIMIPVFTFFRISYAEEAAEHGMEVAAVETEEMRWELIHQAKQMYYGHLLAITLNSRVVELADSFLSDAIEMAEEAIENEDGNISMLDYNKLMVGKATLEAKRAEAMRYIELTKSALTIAMRLDDDEEFMPNNDVIEKEYFELQSVDHYIDIAYTSSPLIEKVEAGIAATQALVDMQESYYWPIIGIGGEFEYGVSTDHIADPESSFLDNPYNEIYGGVGLGIIWEFNPWNTAALVDQAEAEHQEVVETKNSLQMGLELFVREIYTRIVENEHKIVAGRNGMDNAKSWFMSAGMGYQSGLEDAEEAIMGLVAYTTAANDYYQSMMDFNMACSELSKLLGQEITSLEYNLND